jgi:hypothetical protein
MNKLRNFLMLIVFTLLSALSISGYAQNGNGNSNGGGGRGHEGEHEGGGSVPINKGVLFLLGAGVTIGIYALYKKNRKEIIKTKNN